MKKRIWSLTLAGVMLISLGACGRQEQAATETKSPAEATEEAEPERIEAEEPEETEIKETETETEEVRATSGRIPELCAWKKSYYETADDGTLLMKGGSEVPILTADSSEDYPDLAAGMLKEAEKSRATFEEDLANAVDGAKEWYADSPDAFEGMYYTSYLSVLPERVDAKVTSYYLSYSDYTGGAHGMYGQEGHTFDNETGASLSLSDVLSDASGVQSAVKEELLLAYPDQEMFDDLDEALSYYDVAITETTPSDDNELGYHYPYNWTLTESGIEFYFGPYALAAYAAGAQTVTLTYEDYADIIRPEYLPEGQRDRLVTFYGGLTGLDLTGDGERDSLWVNYDYGEDYETIEGVGISLNEEISESFTDVSEYDSDNARGYYLETTDGKKYVYLVLDGMNDYEGLFAFDLSDGTPRKLGSQVYSRSTFDFSDDGSYSEMLLVDPDRMCFCSRFDFLSSFNAFRYYHPGADGMPESTEPYY